LNEKNELNFKNTKPNRYNKIGKSRTNLKIQIQKNSFKIN